MTQKEVDFVKSQFSVKWGSDLRNLFYTNKGLPRQKLYTKQQILDNLEIPEGDNMFEKEGIYHRLHIAIGALRKEAKKHGLAFIDFRIEQEEGKDIYYHGFLRDIDKLEQTISLYNDRVDNLQKIYDLTYDVTKSQITMIEEKKKELVG